MRLLKSKLVVITLGSLEGISSKMKISFFLLWALCPPSGESPKIMFVSQSWILINWKPCFLLYRNRSVSSYGKEYGYEMLFQRALENKCVFAEVLTLNPLTNNVPLI